MFKEAYAFYNKKIEEIQKKKKAEEPKKAEYKVKFHDVIGIEEYKDEIIDIVRFLQDPSKYVEMGAEIPRGILLEGPPGTGKTLLAKALANEAECNFIYVSGAEVDKFFVGYGAKKIRQIFEEARKKAPSIIFIDEIDTMTMDRKKSTSIMNDLSTLNQLLAEMDGFVRNEKVIVIGATNLSDRIDKALMRPGRFDKTINIPLPDVKGREKLFEFYVKKIKTIEQINCKALAERTTRMSGADVANITNKAIIHAIKNKQEGANNKDFEEVLEQESLGIRKTKPVMDENLKKHMAYYEAAKAVASLVYPNAEPVYKMTILPRGDVTSQTVTKSTEDKLNYNKKELKALVVTALAGRVCEMKYFGEVSSSKPTFLTFRMQRRLQESSQIEFVLYEADGNA